MVESGVAPEWSSAQDSHNGIQCGDGSLGAYLLYKILGNHQWNEVSVIKLIGNVVNALQECFDVFFQALLKYFIDV